MSNTDDLPPLPPPIDPATVTVWTGQIRAILPLLGGIGIGGAWLQHVTDAQISGYVTAGLTIVGVGSWAVSALWSRYDKWQAARKARAVAVASAAQSAYATHAAQMPVIVTVAPGPVGLGVAPVATKVSPTEVASVPLPTPGVPPQPAQAH